MKQWLRCLLFVFLSWPILLSKPTALNAQEEQPGVDLFILIDQSQSMAGTAEVLPTDPENLRIDTAHYLVDYLGFDVLTRSEQTNRVGVVGFGTSNRSKVMVPLSSVAGETIDQSSQIRQTIKEAVVAEQLGFTSVTSALDLTTSQIQQAENLGADRPLLIILITDGSPFDQRELDLADYFAEINESYARLQEQANNKARLFVIGIDAANAYWNGVDRYWADIAVDARRVEQAGEMKTELATILARELGYTGNTLEAGAIYVEPYLDTVSFSVFRYSDAPVKIFYPGNNGDLVAFEPDLAEAKASGDRYDLLIIRNPQPGFWDIQPGQEGERLDILKQVDFSEIQLEPPILEVPANFPLYFDFSLPQGQSLYGQYPLEFALTITLPTGTVESVTCCVPSEDGQWFRSAKTFVPRMPGVYQLDVSAMVQTVIADEIQVIPISGKGRAFSVYEADLTLMPFALNYSQYEPVSDLEIRFTDPQGNAIIADERTPFELVARITLPSGDSTEILFNYLHDGTYGLADPFMLPGDGLKRLEVVGKEDTETDLFVYPFEINTSRNVQLLQPFTIVPPNALIPGLAIQLLDEENIPIDDGLAGKLTVEATIITPDDLPISTALLYDDEQDAFVASLAVPTNTEGEYKLDIVVHTELNGRTALAFTEILFYTVSKTLPYYRITTPSSSNLNIPLYDGLKRADVLLEIQWLQNDQPIDPRRVFVENPAELLTTDVNGSNGLTLTNLSLEPTSTSDASLWGINLDTLNQEGIYTATLHFVGASLVSQAVYPDLNDSQIVFYRTTPDLWRGIKSGINALLVLGFIVVFAWASMEGFQRLWPPFPKGVITFKEQNPVTGSKRQIDMINLFSRRLRRRVITWKPNAPELKTLGIYKVVIRPRPGQRQRNNPGVEIEFLIRQKGTIPMIFTDKGQKTWPGVVGEAKAVYWIEYTY